MIGAVTDRAGLADFLRRRRELLRPADVGLPDGVRRRTPGLRRDEVAQLADMSADYYSRLEQARGAHPSESIVAALARALRCDLDQRDHLYHLAGFAPPARRAGRHLRPGLLSLAERLVDVPVYICTDLNEVLWQNTLADLVTGPLGPPGRSRNGVWRWFTEPGTQDRVPEEDRARHATGPVNDLRATHSRRAGDADVTSLVADLLDRSPEFRLLWEQHDVAVRRLDRKRMAHPEVGLLDLTCEVLLTPEDDLKVVAHFPTEGTGTREKLELLRVIGHQDLQATPGPGVR
jgi:transcriptional regulator with XRE-family HTH domain